MTGSALTGKAVKHSMKVKDIIERIKDVNKDREFLEEIASGKLTDKDRIPYIFESIDEHLECYVELLQNKEVK